MTSTLIPTSLALPLTIDGIDVDVHGPREVLAILKSTYRRHLRNEERDVEVIRNLRVRLPSGNGNAMAGARAASESIVHAVAQFNGHHVVRAATLERNGSALAIAGPRNSGKSTIAVHLLARGWKLLADDAVLLTNDGTTVTGHQALMTVSARSAPDLPTIFRGTIERSRWYTVMGKDGRQDLHFYEVDPAHAFGSDVWCDRARLDAVIVLDISVAERRVHTIDHADVQTWFDSEETLLLPTLPKRVRAGVANPSRAGRCAELIEEWFDVHALP